MKVREKIAQKKLKLQAKPEKQKENTVTSPVSKTYTCICKQCKIKYQTVNNLDLDGLGRCPPCRAIHDAELEAMMHKFPQAQKDVQSSYDEIPGIEYKGIKFIPLH